MKAKTWTVDVQDSKIGYRAIVDSEGFTICNPSPMGMKNASLISAAPDLRDALETFLKFFDEMPKGQLGGLVCDIGLLNDAFIKSRRAINKSKGIA